MSEDRIMDARTRRCTADKLANELCDWRKKNGIPIGDNLMWRIESFLNDVAFKPETQEEADRNDRAWRDMRAA